MSTALEQAIDSSTANPRLRLALRLGALLEGGSFAGPWSVGDNGTSYGPYQIHLPVHPDITAQQAADPLHAVLYMLPEYEAALLRVPESAWQADPSIAAAQVVYYAERPFAMYPAARIRAAWAQLTGTAPASDPATGAPGPAPSGSVSGGAVPASGNPLLLIPALVSGLRDNHIAVRAVLVIGGAILLTAGVIVMIHQPVMRAVEAVG
jgi:hypothetical protein